LVAAIALQGYGQAETDRLSVLEEMETNGTPLGMEGDTLDVSYRDNYRYVPVSDDVVVTETVDVELPQRVAGNQTDYQEAVEPEETNTGDNDNYEYKYKYEYQYGADEADEEEKSGFGDFLEEWNTNRKRFRGHWVGMGGGFSNYTTDNNFYTLPDEISYMTLNTGKSFNAQFNFTQMSIGLTRHFGFVTGLGLSWQNYRFEGQNNIQKNYGERNTVFYFENPQTNDLIKRSTLNVAYLTLPVLVEIQIPAGWGNTFNLSAGPVGAVKVSSWSKITLETGEKFINDSDFNFSMFMLGGTARVSYDSMQVYATYYATPLFMTHKTPSGVELFPFEIGLALNF